MPRASRGAGSAASIIRPYANFSGLDLHPHDVLVRLDELVAYLNGKLEVEAGGLAGQHDFVEVDGLAGGHAHGGVVGGVLGLVEAGDRVVQGLAEAATCSGAV